MSTKFVERFLSNSRATTNTESKSIITIFQQAKKSSDFHQFYPFEEKDSIIISYYKSMVDTEIINKLLLPEIQEHFEKGKELGEIKNFLPFDEMHVTRDPNEVEKKLIKGYFRLPADIDSPKDSSAGAIAACGLLLLASKVTAAESPVYQRAGEKILESLFNNYGDWEGMEEGLVLHGTSHFPEGKYTDNPLIYGDYYFVEGLARLKGYKELFW
jgi:hypothetical protein